jgi:hypothetical protein
MSLIQHVTVEEGTDRVEAPDWEPREASIYAGIEGAVDRRLSFNPLSHPGDLETIVAVTTKVGANFVSRKRRIGRRGARRL